MTIESNAVWFITGCSGGLGKAFARMAISKGYRVVATARRLGDLDDIVAPEGSILRLELDVTDPSARERAVAEATRRFGRIDVLVNNAGHGYVSAVEEGEDDKIRALFELNFFALAALIRLTVPEMRVRRSGWVVNLSSAAGLVGNEGSGYYAASKFAVEGLSDALARELEPFDVDVLLVEPGPVRTDFAGRSMAKSDESGVYAETAGARRKAMLSASGKQAGDPDRVVELVHRAMYHDNPPRRLVVGKRAMDTAENKNASLARDVAAWSEGSLATDFES